MNFKQVFLLITLLFFYTHIIVSQENTAGSLKNTQEIRYTSENSGFFSGNTSYDSKNRISEIRFFSNSKPIEVDGNHLYQFQYGKDGKSFKVRQKNLQNKLTGIAKFKVSSNGFEVVNYSFYKPKQNIFAKHIFYDQGGNKIEEKLLGEKRKPAANKSGISTTKYTNNSSGKRIKEEYFDLEGNPVEDKNGVAKYQYIYDTYGNKINSKFFGKDGNLKTNKKGIAIELYTYDYTVDSGGKLVTAEFFNEKKEPAEDENGIARYVYAYDKKGNQTYMEIFSKDLSFTEDKNGIAKYLNEYNEAGKKIRSTTYGKNRKLKDGLQTGFAKIEYEYNEDGDILSESYYNISGKLKMNKSGFSKVIHIYKNKKLMEINYLNDKGLAAETGFGYSTCRFLYEGKKTSKEYRNAKNEPVLTNQGFFKQVTEVNDKNQKTSEEFFDTEGKPAGVEDGIYIYEYRYDSEGRHIETTGRHASGDILFKELYTYETGKKESLLEETYKNSSIDRGNYYRYFFLPIEKAFLKLTLDKFNRPISLNRMDLEENQD